ALEKSQFGERLAGNVTGISRSGPLNRLGHLCNQQDLVRAFPRTEVGQAHPLTPLKSGSRTNHDLIRSRLPDEPISLPVRQEWFGEPIGHLTEEVHVVWAVPGFVVVELLVQVQSPQLRQDQHAPAVQRLPGPTVDDAGRETTEGGVIIRQGLANLSQLV